MSRIICISLIHGFIILLVISACPTQPILKFFIPIAYHHVTLTVVNFRLLFHVFFLSSSW